MKRIGLYPRVRTDASGAGVVSQAGSVALIETVRAAGLDRALSTTLARWRRPMARHYRGKVIADLGDRARAGLSGRCRGACVPSRRCSAWWLGPDGFTHD